MSEANKQTVRKIQQAWSEGRLGDLDQYYLLPAMRGAPAAQRSGCGEINLQLTAN